MVGGSRACLPRSQHGDVAPASPVLAAETLAAFQHSAPQAHSGFFGLPKKVNFFPQKWVKDLKTAGGG